jgi:acetyl esterase/lipase
LTDQTRNNIKRFHVQPLNILPLNPSVICGKVPIQTMKHFLSLTLLLLSLTLSYAQMQTSIPLWPEGAPGALGTNDWDIPTLTPYLPDSDKATGAAMVICPGGGYVHLAPHEGNDYALWLNQHGITAFVLKYRLGSNGYHHPAMLEDAARAVRWVRAHAKDYRVDTQRVGIMGSSAGGHLASTLLTHFDSGNPDSPDPIEQQSSRPDLGILCYAVISLGKFAHQGSKQNLLGPNPQTPPCFVWTTFEDNVVPMENSLLFAEALRENHVPFDLHIYQQGGHGMGLNAKAPFTHPHPWANDCLFWLKAQKFIN